MRRLAALLATSLLLGAVPASAQAPPPAKEAKGFNAIRQADLKRDLTYLTSDELAGRMSLQPGNDMAIAWIADQFAKAGLQPGAKDASGKPTYLQPITLIEYRGDPTASSATMTRAGKATTWRAPDVTGAYKTPVDLNAPVVFAGFGITAPELGYDDYAGVDVRGKVVLIFDHEPQEADPKSIFNGTGNTRYATSRVKVLNAQKHGAVAVLMMAEPNRKHATNAERAGRIRGNDTPRATALPAQAIRDDEVRIPLLNVRDEVGAALFAASGTTLSAAQSAIDGAAKPQSRALPDTTLAIQLRNISTRTADTQNVVAILPGSDPKLAAETILVSGHHDHDGMEQCADPANPPISTPPDPRPCPRIWHGADDNGSGTVGVVAMARAFAANPVRPKRSIMFVVFASEERGLLGAYWLAAHPLRPLATTRAMINFDMIGRNETPSGQTDGVLDIPADTTNRLNLIGALYSPDYDKVVKAANASVGLTLDDRFDHERDRKSVV